MAPPNAMVVARLTTTSWDSYSRSTPRPKFIQTNGGMHDKTRRTRRDHKLVGPLNINSLPTKDSTTPFRDQCQWNASCIVFCRMSQSPFLPPEILIKIFTRTGKQTWTHPPGVIATICSVCSSGKAPTLS